MNNHSAPKSERGHLLFLDGLRGLAALYVVAHHAMLQIITNYPSSEMSAGFRHATTWLMFGQMSVDIFIVLSGFCLMIPVARGDGSLRGGVLEFAKRRARRILPPYYAALALSLVLIRLVPELSHPKNFLWAPAVPAFTLSAIISHLLLVHNLSPLWLRKINYPLWSVATEWQIYFIFALALLPIWRRFGAMAAIGFGFFLGYLPRLFFHHQMDGASFQFIGLFALGMSAAGLAYAKTEARKSMAGLPIWGWLSAGACAAYLLLAGLRTQWLLSHYTVNDVLVGVAASGLLLALARQSQGLARRARPFELLVRVLESRPAAALGAFSYSLYLIHAPLLALIYLALSLLPVHAATAFVLSEGVGLPICVGAAYLFHRLFERPFMTERKPRIDRPAEQEVVAASSP